MFQGVGTRILKIRVSRTKILGKLDFKRKVFSESPFNQAVEICLNPKKLKCAQLLTPKFSKSVCNVLQLEWMLSLTPTFIGCGILNPHIYKICQQSVLLAREYYRYRNILSFPSDIRITLKIPSCREHSISILQGVLQELLKTNCFKSILRNMVEENDWCHFSTETRPF